MSNQARRGFWNESLRIPSAKDFVLGRARGEPGGDWWAVRDGEAGGEGEHGEAGVELTLVVMPTGTPASVAWATFARSTARKSKTAFPSRTSGTHG
jgi:hypothetical protein